MTGQERAIADITEVLKNAVEVADGLGLVITVSQTSLQPPAMGHYETTVAVRPKVEYSKS